MEILVDAKKPFLNIVKFNIAKINFATYAECINERQREYNKSKNEMEAEKTFMRSRRLKQITAFNKDGGIIALNHQIFGNMPRPLFIQLNNALNSGGEQKGEIISEDADGVNTPILYKLGTPFSFSSTAPKSIGTEPLITELEFVAKTGGDIEEVLCGDTTMDQTLTLIRTCAKPIGGENTLHRLPSSMIEILSFADGVEIMNKVLPIFVE